MKRNHINNWVHRQCKLKIGNENWFNRIENTYTYTLTQTPSPMQAAPIAKRIRRRENDENLFTRTFHFRKVTQTPILITFFGKWNACEVNSEAFPNSIESLIFEMGYQTFLVLFCKFGAVFEPLSWFGLYDEENVHVWWGTKHWIKDQKVNRILVFSASSSLTEINHRTRIAENLPRISAKDIHIFLSVVSRLNS